MKRPHPKKMAARCQTYTETKCDLYTLAMQQGQSFATPDKARVEVMKCNQED